MERQVLRYRQYGNRNQETVSQLFVSLMCKLLSVDSLWEQGLCASTYKGCWISKKFDDANNSLKVEDFTNRCQNAARSSWQRTKIYCCIRETLSRLPQHSKSPGVTNLKAFLFGGRGESKGTCPNYI